MSVNKLNFCERAAIFLTFWSDALWSMLIMDPVKWGCLSRLSLQRFTHDKRWAKKCSNIHLKLKTDFNHGYSHQLVWIIKEQTSNRWFQRLSSKKMALVWRGKHKSWMRYQDLWINKNKLLSMLSLKNRVSKLEYII